MTAWGIRVDGGAFRRGPPEALVLEMTWPSSGVVDLESPSPSPPDITISAMAMLCV